MSRARCLTAAAATALVLAAAPAPASASRAAGPPAAVSLGDSFISGEAGRWRGNGNTAAAGSRYGTDLAAVDCNADETSCRQDPGRVYGASYDNGCNRSVGAEVEHLASVRVRGRAHRIAEADRINVACSGATAEAVHSRSFKGEPRQVDQLARHARSRDVKLVVLSVGGNDLGFGSIIKQCVTAFTTGSTHCHEQLSPGFPERVARMGTAVREAVRAVRTTMSDAGYDDSDYRFVLQSYPSPLPRGADNRYPDTDWSRWSSGGCPFFDDDSDWARDEVVPAIADGLRRVAADEGLDFLDLRDALDGHEVCAEGVGQATADNDLRHPLPRSRGEWVRWIGLPGVGQGQAQEYLHPNAYGQEVLGGCLNAIAAGAGRELRCTPDQG
ncbi:GDSL-type esterase/lipase family protein [Saccharothrix syringae]|uniref:SGNH hydrolase-type esterase domain-containing protein n=1 Tax=Saccharothrix syringae TaxID=103733 RepID=A0A5Q0H756_SACSY|nr:GDSL-type esterase/lipase family protein [Saccharothrix syringae]QFZ22031.1 hypothetical protein EKG83_35615 [Saccharothrix syringae]